MTTSDHLEVRVDPATGVAVLVGQLSFGTAAGLRGRLPHAAHLVLDVSAVDFCDSAGLAALIGTRRRAELAGGGVTLLGVGPALARLLRLTGVEPLFTFREAGEAPATGRGEPA